MEQVNTLDVAFDGRITSDTRAQVLFDGLQRAIVGSWVNLREMLVAKRLSSRPDAGPGTKPLSGYYSAAYERASAATPITSSRQLL